MNYDATNADQAASIDALSAGMNANTIKVRGIDHQIARISEILVAPAKEPQNRTIYFHDRDYRKTEHNGDFRVFYGEEGYNEMLALCNSREPSSFMQQLMPDIMDTLVQAVKTAVDTTTDTMNALEAPSERYISGITSTCGNCGYEETIEIPEQAEPTDIIQAMQAVRSACPECQERARKLAEKQIDGLSDEEILMEDNNQ